MTVMNYRTRDGLAGYGFSIEFQSGRGWRVYIIFLPFMHDQDDSLHLPYQSTDDNGRRYVNWSGKIDSLGEAKTVAELWAELVQNYLHTQERIAHYVEVIKQYQHAQEQRRGTSAGQNLRDAVHTGTPSPEQDDCGPAIHVPKQQNSEELQQHQGSGRVVDEVA